MTERIDKNNLCTYYGETGKCQFFFPVFNNEGNPQPLLAKGSKRGALICTVRLNANGKIDPEGINRQEKECVRSYKQGHKEPKRSVMR